MSGVRILGGQFRGRRLPVPAGARPTESRVREALMNRWSPSIPGSRVLDAFAGSGAVGVEALGRGAGAVVWVEKQGRGVRDLRRTVARLSAEPGTATASTTVLRLELPRGVERLEGPFDLIFADPPYAREDLESLVAALSGLLASDGELALEHVSRRPAPAPPTGLELVDSRRYGDCVLSFYRPGLAPGSAGEGLSR